MRTHRGTGGHLPTAGEVACFGPNKNDAFLKAMMSTGMKLPKLNILVSIQVRMDWPSIRNTGLGAADRHQYAMASEVLAAIAWHHKRLEFQRIGMPCASSPRGHVGSRAAESCVTCLTARSWFRSLRVAPLIASADARRCLYMPWTACFRSASETTKRCRRFRSSIGWDTTSTALRRLRLSCRSVKP